MRRQASAGTSNSGGEDSKAKSKPKTRSQVPLPEKKEKVNEGEKRNGGTRKMITRSQSNTSQNSMTGKSTMQRSNSIVSNGDNVSCTSNGEVDGSVSTTVQVAVRVRPLMQIEKEREEAYAWLLNEQNTLCQDPSHMPKRSAVGKDGDSMPSQPATFSFDNLYGPDSSNQHIYESNIHNIVYQTLQGHHGSVFTYGQTSSGKTYTMNGTLKQPGIIPQAIYDCFESIHEFKEREFLFRISYLEIYNETVNDLLNPGISQIKIQHDPKCGIVLNGVKEQVVSNPAQVVALLQGGEAYRHVASTKMNDKSSRAHTLFKIIVESKALDMPSGGQVRVSTLNLVDLAGSENAKMTNSKGERAREAKFINQSLLTLSTIIHKLSEEGSNNGKKRGVTHLPYRDSKLTRILQTALSGNCYISIICTISPTLKCTEESHNTLKFASRAKKIKMKADINEMIDEKALLSQYRQEIEQLKAQLAKFQDISSASLNNAVTELINDAGEQSTDVEDSDDPEQNQELILQMISHMEQLILKGESSASGFPTHQHSAKSGRRIIDRRRSDVSTLSSGTRRSLARADFEESMRRSIADSATLASRMKNANKENKESSSAPKTEPKIEEEVSENPFKNIIKQNIPEDDEELFIDDHDDYFVSLNRLSCAGNRSREGSFEDSSSSALEKDDEPERKLQVSSKLRLNPRRVTLSCSDDQRLRRVSKSADAADESSRGKESACVEPIPPMDLVLPQRPKEDPVLHGVTQMLSILKQHVTKPTKTKSKLKGKSDCPLMSPSRTQSAPTDEQKAMQDEINRLQESVDKKDSMLSMLTEGLKEVEVNQEGLLKENEEMAEELRITREAYLEVEEENKLIRAELERLQVCLDAREKQFFEATGRKPEDEEF